MTTTQSASSAKKGDAFRIFGAVGPVVFAAIFVVAFSYYAAQIDSWVYSKGIHADSLIDFFNLAFLVAPLFLAIVYSWGVYQKGKEEDRVKAETTSNEEVSQRVDLMESKVDSLELKIDRMETTSEQNTSSILSAIKEMKETVAAPPVVATAGAVVAPAKIGPVPVAMSTSPVPSPESQQEEERERLLQFAHSSFVDIPEDDIVEKILREEKKMNAKQKTEFEQGLDLGATWMAQAMLSGKVKSTAHMKGKKEIPLGGISVVMEMDGNQVAEMARSAKEEGKRKNDEIRVDYEVSEPATSSSSSSKQGESTEPELDKGTPDLTPEDIARITGRPPPRERDLSVEERKAAEKYGPGGTGAGGDDQT